MRWTDKRREREQWIANWHPWFSWYPVRIGDHWVWLETVARMRAVVGRFIDPGYEWRYAEWPLKNEPKGCSQSALSRKSPL